VGDLVAEAGKFVARACEIGDGAIAFGCSED